MICFQQTIFDNSTETECGNKVVICFQQTIFDNSINSFSIILNVVICFQQTIFDNRRNCDWKVNQCCDLLSTNDLWQLSRLWPMKHNSCDLLFNKRSLTTSNTFLAGSALLWFAFNKRSLTTGWVDLLTRYKLWFTFNKRLLKKLKTNNFSCDLLSTNDLWQLLASWPKQAIRLWFAFNKRSLTTVK